MMVLILTARMAEWHMQSGPEVSISTLFLITFLSSPCSVLFVCVHMNECPVSPCRLGACWLLFAVGMLHVKKGECSEAPPARWDSRQSCHSTAISLSPQTCGKGYKETKVQLHSSICIHTAGQVQVGGEARRRCWRATDWQLQRTHQQCAVISEWHLSELQQTREPPLSL